MFNRLHRLSTQCNTRTVLKRLQFRFSTSKEEDSLQIKPIISNQTKLLNLPNINNIRNRIMSRSYTANVEELKEIPLKENSESLKIQNIWSKEISQLHWDKLPEKILNESNIKENYLPKWFPLGRLNLAYNCLVHNKVGEERAISYYNAYSNQFGFLTYNQLRKKVNRLSGVLKSLGVENHDRVILSMSNSVEFVISVLACLQIGAVFHAIPVGLGSQKLEYKINSLNPKLIITASCEGKLI